MFGFIIVTDKIAGAVIELDRTGAIVDGFGWFIYSLDLLALQILDNISFFQLLSRDLLFDRVRD